MDNDQVIYNRDAVQKSLELLNESNNSFHETGMNLKRAMEILNEVKGNDLLNKVENLTNENTPKNLMTMCDENIGNTISNINRGVDIVEGYIEGKGGNSQGNGQPSQPNQPSRPEREEPTPPNGPQDGQNNGQEPSPPSPPEANTTREEPVPPTEPSPPSGSTSTQTPTTGPNGETAPSEPTPPSAPDGNTVSAADVKKGTLIGSLIGLGIGAAAAGGTTAAVVKSKKAKENEHISKYISDFPEKDDE